MPSDYKEAKDTREAADARAETATEKGLSPAGRRAMQGTSDAPAQPDVDHSKGRDFEQWAKKEVFRGEGRRLTVYPEDNPHLDKLGGGVGISKVRRQSDAYLDKDGFIYELKAGYEKGSIDREQAEEYALMQDAGYVFERDASGRRQETPTKINGVSYIFESKTGAEANRSELEQYGFGILHRDENDRLQQLK